MLDYVAFIQKMPYYVFIQNVLGYEVFLQRVLNYLALKVQRCLPMKSIYENFVKLHYYSASLRKQIIIQPSTILFSYYRHSSDTRHVHKCHLLSLACLFDIMGCRFPPFLGILQYRDTGSALKLVGLH